MRRIIRDVRLGCQREQLDPVFVTREECAALVEVLLRRLNLIKLNRFKRRHVAGFPESIEQRFRKRLPSYLWHQFRRSQFGRILEQCLDAKGEYSKPI